VLIVRDEKIEKMRKLGNAAGLERCNVCKVVSSKRRSRVESDLGNIKGKSQLTDFLFKSPSFSLYFLALNSDEFQKLVKLIFITLYKKQNIAEFESNYERVISTIEQIKL